MKYLILLCALFLVACQSAGRQYKQPLDGEAAALIKAGTFKDLIDDSKRILPAGTQDYINVVNEKGCYYGRTFIDMNGIRLKPGEKAFFTTEYTWTDYYEKLCRNSYAFTPEKDAVYKIKYYKNKNSCITSVVKMEDGSVETPVALEAMNLAGRIGCFKFTPKNKSVDQ